MVSERLAVSLRLRARFLNLLRDMTQILRAPPVRGNIRFRDARRRIEGVEGLLVPGQEEWLFKTVQSLPDGARVLEIGSYKGRSSISLGLGCVGSLRHVFSIDTFGGVYQDVEDRENLRSDFERGFFHEWQENIRQNSLLAYVTPLVGKSREIARIWAAPIHMLFIDGSHEYRDVVDDFDGFAKYVVSGGIIALHDVCPNWQGCWLAWHKYVKERLQDTGQVSSLAFGRKP